MEEKENDILTVEEKIVKMLRTVYDPEIPVLSDILHFSSSHSGKCV